MGSSSSVMSMEEQDEISRRVMRASADKHRLTKISLSLDSISRSKEAMSKLNKSLSKAADRVVSKVDPYSQSVKVSKVSMAVKKREIDELKRTEKLVQGLINSLGPMQDELSTLIHDYTYVLSEMESSREGSIHKLLSFDETALMVKRDQQQDSFDVVNGIISRGPLHSERMQRHSADLGVAYMAPKNTLAAGRNPKPLPYPEPQSPAPAIVEESSDNHIIRKIRSSSDDKDLVTETIEDIE